MSSLPAAERLVARYFRSWQNGDLTGLRACLADAVRFDWGSFVYTDPDEFVDACESGLQWGDVTLLGSICDGGRAFILYEGINLTDGIRLRTAEYLGIEGGLIATSIVVYSIIGAVDE